MKFQVNSCGLSDQFVGRFIFSENSEAQRKLRVKNQNLYFWGEASLRAFLASLRSAIFI